MPSHNAVQPRAPPRGGGGAMRAPARSLLRRWRWGCLPALALVCAALGLRMLLSDPPLPARRGTTNRWTRGGARGKPRVQRENREYPTSRLNPTTAGSLGERGLGGESRRAWASTESGKGATKRSYGALNLAADSSGAAFSVASRDAGDWARRRKEAHAGAIAARERSRSIFGEAALRNSKWHATGDTMKRSTVNASARMAFLKSWKLRHPWPPSSRLQEEMVRRNRLPVRNAHFLAGLEQPDMVIVQYVHKRPQYLKASLAALSSVIGIDRALLIISHDGEYPEMDALARGIAFCAVKQLHAPWSPHLFRSAFPGAGPRDCYGDVERMKKWHDCDGTHDSFGHFRDRKIVSLKHHWWWLMNTVWDGLEELRGYQRHVLFLEEDHLLFPNAILQVQALIRAKDTRFRDESVAAMLAPYDPQAKGEQHWDAFVLEEWGNIGYAFNRSVWQRIHGATEVFCSFDDYNWDVSVHRGIVASWPVRAALRWTKPSARHFGACGFHMKASTHLNGMLQAGAQSACAGEALDTPTLLPGDFNWTAVQTAPVFRRYRRGQPARFLGWGGWGDERDRELCRFFAQLYRAKDASGPMQQFPQKQPRTS